MGPNADHREADLAHSLSDEALWAEVDRRNPPVSRGFNSLRWFMGSYRRNVGATVEVLVFRGDQVLLIRRDDPRDLGYSGMMYNPGGFVLMHETIGQAIRRIAERELGVDVRYWQCAGLVNNPHEVREDPFGSGEVFSGHHLHIPIVIHIDGEPAKGSWHRIGDLPDNVIKHQIPSIMLGYKLHRGEIPPTPIEEYME